MKTQYKVLAILLSFFVLGGLSCSSSDSNVRVDDVTIATEISFNNEAENSVTEIAATTRMIYLSARVVEPTSKTKVRVKWYRLPNDLIASEDFEGSGGSFDFDEDRNESFLASHIEREDLVWSLDDYRTDVLLDGEVIKSVFFKIVSDDDATQAYVSDVIKDIKISDERNSDLKIIHEKTTFSPYTNIIYVQVDTQNANPDMEIRTVIRYVKDNLEIASLESAVLGDTNVTWELVRESLGKRWQDNLWAEGSYEVSVFVDGVKARERTFVVE